MHAHHCTCHYGVHKTPKTYTQTDLNSYPIFAFSTAVQATIMTVCKTPHAFFQMQDHNINTVQELACERKRFSRVKHRKRNCKLQIPALTEISSVIIHISFNLVLLYDLKKLKFLCCPGLIFMKM